MLPSYLAQPDKNKKVNKSEQIKMAKEYSIKLLEQGLDLEEVRQKTFQETGVII